MAEVKFSMNIRVLADDSVEVKAENLGNLTYLEILGLLEQVKMRTFMCQLGEDNDG